MLLPFMRLPNLILFLLSFQFGVLGNLQRHNSSFTPDYVLRVTAGNFTFDCQSRYSVLINGSSPGPTLYLTEGETTWVRVYNDLSSLNTTVHWHGLSQRTAPFSDGTPQISQWPIPSDHFFDYEIHPEIGDAGTYFYHAHVGFQAITAYAPLIVKDQKEPAYSYDEDIVISLADYYIKTDAQVETGLLANPFVWSGETNALLFNGQSGTNSISNATDSTCAPYVLKVKPDTLYRIRFIGTTAISLVTLGIEGHDDLAIIEADGSDTQQFGVDHLQVAPGQRFSVLLKTRSAEEVKNQTNYWIRYENRERPANISGYALLSYDIPGSELPSDLPSKSPVTLPTVIYNWLEYSLQPKKAENFPRAATRTIKIVTHQAGIYQNSTFKSQLTWQQNGETWVPEKVQVPYLVSIYLNGESAIPDYDAALQNGGWDPKNLAFPAKMGEVIDIVSLSLLRLRFPSSARLTLATGFREQ
jgi:L-ascorbate oxidase